MTPHVAIIMTIAGEPAVRVDAALTAAVATAADLTVEILVAVDPADSSLEELCTSCPQMVVVENPGARRSAGLNRAMARATAPIVCRIDARSRVEAGYLHRCVTRLEDEYVGAVGGHQIAVAEDGTARSRGIARALRNPWLLGAPSYRRREKSGEVDTVYLGAWRRQDIIELGGFDESLDVNEDFDLFRRIRATGRSVWLEDGVDVGYLARSTYRALFGQYFAFGQWKVEFWRLTGSRPNARQSLALAAGASLAVAAMRSVRSVQSLAKWVTLGAAALGVLDHAADREGRLDERSSAILASFVVLSGWSCGVLVGVTRVLTRRR